MPAKIIKAPEEVSPKNVTTPLRIFLAGSIDMGEAENWQEKVEQGLSHYDIEIMNPRRDDWDSSWEQSIDNGDFFEQVDWELTQLENADLIIYYFDPNGKAPITLMELGAFAKEVPSIVCCPKGFWRKGNVEVFCYKYEIPMYESFNEMMVVVKKSIEAKS